MNDTYSVRQYWCSKYEARFGQPYDSDLVALEFKFIGSIVKKYGKYTVLEAIDRFFERGTKKKLVWFSNPKYFEQNYSDLVRTAKINKFRRFLNDYPEPIKTRARSLVSEYSSTINDFRSEGDVAIRNEIQDSLTELTLPFFNEFNIV